LAKCPKCGIEVNISKLAFSKQKLFNPRPVTLSP